PRPAPGMLGRLDQEPPGVLGAGLRDRSPAALLVRGPLGGDEAEEGGQLARVREALEVADLGAEADRRQDVDAAKAAQAGDRLGPWALGRKLGEGCLERRAALAERLDRRQVVGEGGLRGAILEGEPPQPAAMADRPAVARSLEANAAAAQEVREPLAGAVEVAAQVFARADQVAQLLLGDLGDADEVKLAGGEQAGEALGGAGVGLDPIGGLARDQPRGADAHVEAALTGRTGEPEAGRAGLVDRHRPRPESLE